MHSMAAALILVAGLGNGPIHPYDAEVVQEDASVRSGPGKTHYETSRLHRGEKVRVHRHEPGGWCMITPPPGSFNLVPANAVREIGQSKGEIIDVGVPAYIGSEFGQGYYERYHVQLSTGERVQLQSKINIRKPDGRSVTMYKIHPPRNDFRWVQGNALASEKNLARDEREDDPFGEENKFGVKPAPKPREKYEESDRDWDDNKTWDRDDNNDRRGGDRRGGRDDRNEDRNDDHDHDHADNDHGDHDHDHDHNGNQGRDRKRGSGLKERPIVRTKDDHAVRRSLPQDDEIAAQRRQIESLDDRFREIVNRHPSHWRFREIEDDYRRLLEEVTVPALASQIQMRLTSVHRYQELRSEYNDYVQLASETSRRDAQLLSLQRSGDPNPGGSRFPTYQAGGPISYAEPHHHHEHYSPAEYPAPAPAPAPSLPPAPAPSGVPVPRMDPISMYQALAPAPAPASGYSPYGQPQYPAPAPQPSMQAQQYAPGPEAFQQNENPVPAPDPAEQFSPPAGPTLAPPETDDNAAVPAPSPAPIGANPVPDPAAAFGPSPAQGALAPGYPSVQPTYVAPQPQPQMPAPYGNMPQQYPQQQYPTMPQPGIPQGYPTSAPGPYGAPSPMIYAPQPQGGMPYQQGGMPYPQGGVMPPENAFLPPQGAMPVDPNAAPVAQSPGSFAAPQEGLVPAQGNVFAPPPPSMPAAQADAQRPQFDGAGIIQRSATAAPGQPQHVLLTPNGRVLAYLQGEPGVNLDSYVGQPMGLYGQRSHRPDLSADMLSVRGATPVRLKQSATP